MLLKGRVAALIDIEDLGETLVPCVSFQCRVFYDKVALRREVSYLRDVMTKLKF